MVYGEVELNWGLDDEALTIIFELGSESEDDSQLMQGLFQGTIRTLAWKGRWKQQT
jgi:hypothetical protein